jgi:hypothetical protein
VGGRIEKRWRLADVWAHFERKRMPADEREVQELDDLVNAMLAEVIVPQLLTAPAFVQGVTGAARSILKASKAQALDLLQAVTAAVALAAPQAVGLAEFDAPIQFRDDALARRWGAAKKQRKQEAFIAEHWPDGKRG